MYKFIPKSVVSVIPVVVNNQSLNRCFDSFDNEDFVVNRYGHIRSDFAVLMESTNGVEMAKVLAKMQADFVSSSSRYDGMSFEEIVRSYKPRWCQMPGEVDRFEQYLIDNALDFYKKLKNDIDEETAEAIRKAEEKRAAETVESSAVVSE